ncbi:MAG: HlyC/CorC family transporter [Calditrichaeota bacterium]|jgi:CBS domain containing-hemolysin-like protein|nr:HlyC/CorC family transporter [Calditrichota bacterium]
MRFYVRIIILLAVLSLPALALITGGGNVPNLVTESDVTQLIIYILLALVVSFMCSIAEAVLLSVTPSFIEGLKEKKPKLSGLLKKLKQENVDHSLAAILTLNTIAHTIGAIGAGAKATTVFGSAWFGLFSTLMTLLILFLSEIIPKTLGALHWVVLARPVALFVQALILVLFPLVWISEQITRLFSRGQKIHIFSRDELIAMTRIGEQTGDLRGDESHIIRNLFHFSVQKTTDIMTPRTVITALPESITITEAAEQAVSIQFSRLPVYKENIDNITGFILKEDILLKKLRGEESESLTSLCREIHTVPESIPLPDLFKDLLTLRKHIALVIDEHGGTSGLVTLEDLVETMVGQEIMDETDTVKDMQVLAREKWKHRGRGKAES